MPHFSKNRTAGWSLFLVLLIAPQARGQQQTPAPGATQAGPGQQTPATATPETTGEAARPEGEVDPQPPPDPDPTLSIPGTAPLSVSNGFIPETTGGVPSFVFGTVQFYQTADTNTRQGPGTARIDASTLLMGRIGLRRRRQRAETTLDYAGGGYIFNTRSRSNLNAPVQRFSITQSVFGRRSALMISNSLGYLPESSFGFGGFGGFDAYGSGLAGGFSSSLAYVNPLLTPSQSILGGRGGRISNTAIAQFQYRPGPRSSIMFSGGHGLLHFFESGGINSKFGTGMVGYGLTLSPKDSLSVGYTINLFRFGADTNLPVSRFESHLAFLSYGRRLTGRLALELSAGPQMLVFRNPISGSRNRLSWSTHNSLHRRSPNSDLRVMYSHYTSSGSGVFVGAETDLVHFSAGRQLTRNWSWSFNPGYARNRSLRQTSQGSETQRFDSGYAGTTLNRALGRHASMFVNYYFRGQRASDPFCVGTECGRVLTGHSGGVGINWTLGPKKIE